MNDVMLVVLICVVSTIFVRWMNLKLRLTTKQVREDLGEDPNSRFTIYPGPS